MFVVSLQLSFITLLCSILGQAHFYFHYCLRDNKCGIFNWNAGVPVVTFSNYKLGFV